MYWYANCPGGFSNFDPLSSYVAQKPPAPLDIFTKEMLPLHLYTVRSEDKSWVSTLCLKRTLRKKCPKYCFGKKNIDRAVSYTCVILRANGRSCPGRSMTTRTRPRTYRRKKRRYVTWQCLREGTKNDSHPSFMQQLFIHPQERFKVVTEMRL